MGGREASERGARAEAFVAERLERDGWSVLARNWHARGGEIDLVVARGDALRFVEVKARAEGDPSGLESITRAKQQKLIRAAQAWLLQHPTPGEVCFAVAAVEMGMQWSIEWIDDAFDA